MNLSCAASQAAKSDPRRVIDQSEENFSEQFNRTPFMVSHHLAGHPLFELPRLAELANLIGEIGERSGERFKVTALSSQVPAHVKWSDMQLQEQIEQAILHIDQSGSLVTIKSANLDPDYDQLMQQILQELEDLTGTPLQRDITWAEAYIFISSPGSVTPYHIDHESNFLFQIHGQKDVNLFDPSNRTLLPEQEIELYFLGDLQAANYQPSYQDQAQVYHLTPGKAVHHPVLAPHWVKNGKDYSVSLSINFCLRPLDLRARVYQANCLLRKLGIQPTPPGISSWRDRVKIAAIGAFAQRNPKTKRGVVFSGIDRIKTVSTSLCQFT
jgi:hypothetical protein